MPRWLFPSNIHIQFIIFNTYFSTKLSFTDKKRYYLHVLGKCLYILQELRSIIYFWQLIHSLSLCSRGNGTSFAFMSYIIISAKFRDVTFLNNFYFVSFFYHFSICQQRKVRLVTLSKSHLSSMIIEVIRTNFRLFKFFLRENFTSIKSIKSKKSIKNIYKRISNFLKHKTLNKKLSLRCSL